VAFTIGTKDGLPDTHRALLFASLSLLGLRRCATGIAECVAFNSNALSDG